MEKLLLCVSSADRRFACQLQAGASGLAFVAGTPGAEERAGAVIAEMAKRGAPIRVERIAPGRIDVDIQRVGPDSPRYLEGCAAAFHGRGWSARIYPERLAETWRKLQILPVPEDIRASVSDRLDALSSEALAKLEEHLDEALDDFAKLG
jgi:hypothetical protein